MLLRSAIAVTIIFFCASIMSEEQQQDVTNVASEESVTYTNEQALAISQAAIGKTVGHYKFTSSTGEVVTSKSFQGKPLIISRI